MAKLIVVENDKVEGTDKHKVMGNAVPPVTPPPTDPGTTDPTTGDPGTTDPGTGDPGEDPGATPAARRR